LVYGVSACISNSQTHYLQNGLILIYE